MAKTSSTAKEKIRPLADYLMIEPLEQETTLPSGIILPDTAKEKPQKGKVIATGNGKKNEKFGQKYFLQKLQKKNKKKKNLPRREMERRTKKAKWFRLR